MNKARGSFELVKTALAAALLTTLMGCAAYVDGGGYGGTVIAPGPVFYGDFHDRGHDVHVFSDRGHASRGFAHRR